MSRQRGSVTKLARNLGGTLDGYPKTENLRKNYPSGQHGQARKKTSEYRLQLQEKQKLRKTFGVQEKQFVRYYKEAVRRKGVTGTILMQLLEGRLDNVVYRAGFARSRPQARQYVAHGHVLVDGNKVDIASYQVKPGQVVSLREKSIPNAKELLGGENPVIPHWVESDLVKFTASLKGIPEREDMDPTIKENLIIEYYSR